MVSAIGPGKSGALEVEQVQRKKDYYAEHGLIWDVIENLSPEIYYKVMLGQEGREQQMDQVCASIRAVPRQPQLQHLAGCRAGPRSTHGRPA